MCERLDGWAMDLVGKVEGMMGGVKSKEGMILLGFQRNLQFDFKITTLLKGSLSGIRIGTCTWTIGEG